MPQTHELTSWSSMTPAINEVKSPLNFLFNFLGYAANGDARPTKEVELSFLRRGRKIAPLVKRGGSAIITDGHTEEFATLQPPHIRIKRQMTATELLNNRRPGSVIFPTPQDMRRARDEYMARELRHLVNDSSNTLEWLAAQTLRGAISYEDAEHVAFLVTFPRLATHDIDVGAAKYWNNGASIDIEADFETAAELVNDDTGLTVTDVIMSGTAATAFRNDPTMLSRLDNRRRNPGELDLTTPFRPDGALFMGATTNGIRVWRYNRSVTMADGSTEKLIRDKYVEFVAVQPEAEFVTYYGAIEDDNLFDGGLLASERFSKSWKTEDPAARWSLLETNPLPTPRRPDATVSMKVISG